MEALIVLLSNKDGFVSIDLLGWIYAIKPPFFCQIPFLIDKQPYYSGFLSTFASNTKTDMRNLIITLLLLFCIRLSASPLNYRNIGLQQGLSNGFVLDMTMDRQGFLWVATESGLNRIAGNKCTVFRVSNSDIACDECVGVYYHKPSNSVWVHFKTGELNVFDCNTQRFWHFPRQNGKHPTVSDVNTAADGAVWIAYNNGTLQHYDPFTKKSYFISSRIFPHAWRGVRSIFDDGEGHLYMGLRMDGLYIYNLHTTRTKYFSHKPGDANSLPGNNVRCVFVDHRQNVWIGTNFGLALFDINTGKFRTFRHIVINPFSPSSDDVHGIIETKRHQLWVASDVGGVSILNLDKFNYPHKGDVSFMQLTRENGRISSNNIRRVIEDFYGNIWIGNYSTGIDFIPSMPNVFHTLYAGGSPVTNTIAMFFDRKGALWIGQDSKISMIQSGSVEHTWDFSSAINNTTGTAFSLCNDQQGNVWIGTNDNGALILNPKSNHISRYSLGQNYDVHALLCDSHGKVWIGTENGLFSYNKGKCQVEKKYNAMMGRTPTVYSLLEDDLGQLWVGCNDKGVFVFDRSGKLRARLRRGKGVPSNLTNHLFRDRDGSVWIATTQGLVYVPNPARPYDTKIYNERQGLKESHIRAITQDRLGNIWVSMFSGIARLDMKKQRFYNFDFESGVPTGNFVEASGAMASNGDIYFGSPGGVCYFNPRQLTVEKPVSNVEIIDCERIGSQSDEFLGRIISPDYEGKLVLSHNDNTFKFSFTVRNYAQEGDVEYSYMMKGLDDKWHSTEGDDEVTFRNLKPGSYTFIVRAKLKNQDWSQASRDQLDVVVRPPLWLTWWAKTLYALMVLGIIVYLFRSYRQRLLLQSSLAQTRWESEQKQKINEERLQFFTNITHELRTPLTLILGPAEDMADDSRLPDIFKKKVNGIKASAERLLSLINDLLEFRKTETNNRRLSVAKGDLSPLVRELGNRFRDLNRNNRLVINVSVEQGLPEVFFDSEVITTVINNLMSNAVKYTPQGEVTLSLQRIEGGKLEIAVRDTGYGMDKDAIPHIFERYYQERSKHQASGTGIGLAFVKSLSELHQATLSVESEKGKGSRFAFILDMGNTYPDALHKEDLEIQNNRQSKDDDTDNRPLLLIVEDNADIRQYIADALSTDFRITQAANGLEGERHAFNDIPDLIVSDIMMPEENGIDMTRKLKADIRTSHIPIILLTAKTGADNQQEGYDSGADSYLTKPFSARLLQSRINNILKGRRRLADYLASHTLRNDDNSTGKKDTQPPASEEMNVLSDLDRKFIEEMDMLIEKNMSTEELDIAFFTDKMAMSHSTLYRKVKALTGMSVNEYVKKAKLRKSRELLQTGRYSVGEVASLTGFNNLGNFRESFKKEFGVTPSKTITPS